MITTLAYRSVGEWVLESSYSYNSPFIDVSVTGQFTSSSGEVIRVPGFYDGDGIWRVRFNPGEIGTWQVNITSSPENPDLVYSGELTVTESNSEGFLRSMSGEAWGFHYENGDPVLIFGDTNYHIFGAAHCDLDAIGYLKRRKTQGFNLIRARLQVSRFHGPEGYSHWQNKSTWPWGGSEQAPQFDRFNLDWFRTVDKVMQAADEIGGIGFEMIMQAWGFEYPFNNRAVFTAEWEQIWIDYLIARYDAYNSVYFWTLMNEYEYYPDGKMAHSKLADLWAIRIARYVKSVAGHGHIISLHNGPQNPPMAERFASAPDVIDTWMFQEWGSVAEKDGWLTPGIEERIDKYLKGWQGTAILSEYGYERNPNLPVTFPPFDHSDAEHNRRGAWRGIFAGLGIVTGFENTWGPHQILDKDQLGMVYLLHLQHFLSEVIDFKDYRPSSDLIDGGNYEWGRKPLALTAGDKFTVYFPAGGKATLNIADTRAQWFDPHTGEMTDANPTSTEHGKLTFEVPDTGSSSDKPWDWVLVSV